MNEGKAILMELQRQGRTAKWLAAQIPCERTNVYKIFKRHDIDTDLVEEACDEAHRFLKNALATGKWYLPVEEK